MYLECYPPPPQSPMFQQTMQRMASNPEMMEQMIRNNPMFAGNPQATEMVRPPVSRASVQYVLLYVLFSYSIPLLLLVLFCSAGQTSVTNGRYTLV